MKDALDRPSEIEPNGIIVSRLLTLIVGAVGIVTVPYFVGRAVIPVAFKEMLVNPLSPLLEALKAWMVGLVVSSVSTVIIIGVIMGLIVPLWRWLHGRKNPFD